MNFVRKVSDIFISQWYLSMVSLNVDTKRNASCPAVSLRFPSPESARRCLVSIAAEDPARWSSPGRVSTDLEQFVGRREAGRMRPFIVHLSILPCQLP